MFLPKPSRRIEKMSVPWRRALRNDVLLRSSRGYQTAFTLDFIPVFRFVLFTILNCPPNVLWQEYLEHQFPRLTPELKRDKVSKEDGAVSTGRKLDVGNTVKKFLIDQTVGGSVNTILFIAIMGGFKGLSPTEIAEEVQKVRVSGAVPK